MIDIWWFSSENQLELLVSSHMIFDTHLTLLLTSWIALFHIFKKWMIYEILKNDRTTNEVGVSSFSNF
jgi:hypothetical protein